MPAAIRRNLVSQRKTARLTLSKAEVARINRAATSEELALDPASRTDWLAVDTPAMAVLAQPKSKLRPKAAAKRAGRTKGAFKFELTAEDIALDNAISAAAARGLHRS